MYRGSSRAPVIFRDNGFVVIPIDDPNRVLERNNPKDPTLIVYQVNPQVYDYMKPSAWESIRIEIKTWD